MSTELRNTGISVVGAAPWGTHFCHFYETQQDLLDTLIPYFKAGLESNEFCLWVISDSDLINVAEAEAALAQAVPNFDRHLSAENMEIFNGHDWYFHKDVLNLERVTSAWEAKIKRALARGYDGLRASGDTFWLAEQDWKDFFAYEKQVNDWLTDKAMTVLCTYPLAKSGAAEVLDVVQAHQFAIARRQGEWEAIETPQLIQAKAEIKKLNAELEQRVIRRTNELRVANDDLRKEITERKQAEEKLKATTEQLRALSARLQSAREEEGIRIAREIHDELGSALTSLRWDLETIGKDFSEPGEQSPVPAPQKKIAAMLGVIDTTINLVRRIASELRPGVLDDLGLAVAIKWQAQQFQARSGILVNWDCPLAHVSLNQAQSATVFRIFQEAMTNILRHAHATRVDVKLVEEAGGYLLTIKDDGRGILEDERSAQSSLGLLGMHERAHLMGGEVSITGIQGEGTAVTVRIPIERGTTGKGMGNG